MKKQFLITSCLAFGMMTFGSAAAQSGGTKPGNCAIYAEMSADTVKKDARFNGHDDIAPALMKFAAAQTAKMKAGMADTYAASKAYGYSRERVDELIEEQHAVVRASFFTSTMDKNKLYMDHVQAVHKCGQAQSSPTDLGQSPEAFTKVLQTMAEIVRG